MRRPLFDPELEPLVALAHELGARMDFGTGPNATAGPMRGQDMLEPSTQIVANTTASLETPARDSYQSLIVSLIGITGSNYRLDWKNFSTGQIFGSSNGVGQPGGGGFVSSFVGPMSCNAGDNIGVTITSTPGSAIAFAASMWGSRSRLINVRNDGRPWPTGANLGGANQGGVGSSNLAAPPAGIRVMLRTATLVTVGVTGVVNTWGAVNMTIGGVTGAVLLIQTASSANVMEEWESGLLGDPGTAVTVGIAGGGTVIGGATFDYTQ